MFCGWAEAEMEDSNANKAAVRGIRFFILIWVFVRTDVAVFTTTGCRCQLKSNRHGGGVCTLARNQAAAWRKKNQERQRWDASIQLRPKSATRARGQG